MLFGIFGLKSQKIILRQLSIAYAMHEVTPSAVAIADRMLMVV